VGAQHDEGGVRDIDDVEHAEGDRDADRHYGVETAEQQPREDGVQEQLWVPQHSGFSQSRGPSLARFPGAVSPRVTRNRALGALRGGFQTRTAQASVGPKVHVPRVRSMATPRASATEAQAHLERAGLPSRMAADWLFSRPDLNGDYRQDAAA